MAENLHYKSDAFSMLMQIPKYALDVYNSMYHTNYDNPDDLEVFMLENGISLSIRNDASFIIYNELCVYEHQGSYNPNMAVRDLIYYAELMKNYIKREKIDVFGSTRIKLPTPHFVVFYNGLTKRPEQEIFRLSDLYEWEGENPPIELLCKSININPYMNNEIKKNSYVLNGYCVFVEKVRKYTERETLSDALTMAIDECIKENILREFFQEYGEEVKKVTVLDFTFEKRLELADYNGEKRGIEIGEKNGENKGVAKSILILLARIGDVSEELSLKLFEESDIDKLTSWLSIAAEVNSIEEFEKRIY